MKITDVIHSYQEVLPEPSNHVKVIRLEPPDFRPQTIEVDLASALAGDESVTLQQFDTIWVFGRYEIIRRRSGFMAMCFVLANIP